MKAIHPLRAYRERNNLSQEQLGSLLRRDRITIHRWETGKRKPDAQDIAAIRKLTGISARDLRPDLVELIGSAA